jgi:hypothetical protein
MDWARLLLGLLVLGLISRIGLGFARLFASAIAQDNIDAERTWDREFKEKQQREFEQRDVESGIKK